MKKFETSFNPRARAGRDATSTPSILTMSKFQSTRPCGARQDYEFVDGYYQRFNPRARAGRDNQSCDWSFLAKSFQSTRPCGARHID